jgi:hypothetical protein
MHLFSVVNDKKLTMNAKEKSHISPGVAEYDPDWQAVQELLPALKSVKMFRFICDTTVQRVNHGNIHLFRIYTARQEETMIAQIAIIG